VGVKLEGQGGREGRFWAEEEKKCDVLELSSVCSEMLGTAGSEGRLLTG